MNRDVERRFIGRQPELRALDAALQCAVAGQPRIVLLAGEPGIGKTRTAQELLDHAARSGALPLWGRCPEEPGAPPFWPWLQILRRYLALHDDVVLGQTVGAAAAQIASLDPELARRLSNPAPPTARWCGARNDDGVARPGHDRRRCVLPLLVTFNPTGA